MKVDPDTPAWRRPWYGGDGARGLGALLVFCAHIAFAEGTFAALQWQNLPGRDAVGTFGGEVGLHAVFSPARLVNLFFAFSAYLLARPFIAWALGRSRKPDTTNFYIRRVFRLIPAYWALAAIVILWLVVLGSGTLQGGQTLRTLFVLDGGLSRAGSLYDWVAPLAVTWTVRVEALGYLVLPLLGGIWWVLGRRFGMRGLVAGIALISAATLAVRYANSQYLDGPGVLQWLFIPGLVVALIEAHEPIQGWFARRRRRPTMWLLLAGFLLLIGSEPLETWLTTMWSPDPGSAPVAVLLAEGDSALRAARAFSIPMQIVGAGTMLLALLSVEWQGGPVPLRLDGPVMKWVGVRSYSLYLVHFPVLGFLLPHVAPGEKGLLGYLLLGLVALPTSLIAAALMYRFVEVPGIALGRILTQRRSKAAKEARVVAPEVGAASGIASGPAASLVSAATRSGPAPPAEDEPRTPVPDVPAAEGSALRRRMRILHGGDALRGWAMLGVIGYHSLAGALFLRTGGLDFDQYGPTMSTAIQALQLSVWVFFALSGYLLTRPYAAAIVDRSRPWPSATRYLRHRVGRVVPVFWFMIVVIIVLYGTEGSTTGGIVAMFGFAQVWDPQPINATIRHAWSIDVEVVFYLVLPLAAWACLRLARTGRGGGWAAVALLLGIGVVGTVFAQTWLPTGAADSPPPSQSPIGGIVAFMPGAAIAFAEARWGLRIARFSAAAGVAAMLSVGGLALGFANISLVDQGSPEARFLDTAAAGLIFAGVVLLQISGRGTWAVLRLRIVHWIGIRSYSIFMVHGLVNFELRSLGDGQATLSRYGLVYYVGVVAVSLVVGAVVHALVERPAMRLSRGERPLFEVSVPRWRSVLRRDGSPHEVAPLPGGLRSGD